MRPEELQGIPSNVIVRSLGPEPLVQVDIEGPHPIRPGDVYVLCSDGLSGPVSDREIGAAVSALPPKEACRFLIDLANLQGGPDNITVIVAKVTGGEPGADGAGVPALVPAPRAPWHQRLPWPLLSLLLGIVLALGAIGLTLARLGGGAIMFVLAALALGAGLIGLLLQNRRESTPGLDEGDGNEPKVHRQVACAIELPLLRKLARAEQMLQDRIRDRQWNADWDDFRKHSTQAEQLLQKGDLAESFCEYCRAMRPLTEAVQRQRHKEEVFQPVWDRNSE